MMILLPIVKLKTSAEKRVISFPKTTTTNTQKFVTTLYWVDYVTTSHQSI